MVGGVGSAEAVWRAELNVSMLVLSALPASEIAVIANGSRLSSHRRFSCLSQRTGQSVLAPPLGAFPAGVTSAPQLLVQALGRRGARDAAGHRDGRRRLALPQDQAPGTGVAPQSSAGLSYTRTATSPPLSQRSIHFHPRRQWQLHLQRQYTRSHTLRITDSAPQEAASTRPLLKSHLPTQIGSEVPTPAPLMREVRFPPGQPRRAHAAPRCHVHC